MAWWLKQWMRDKFLVWIVWINDEAGKSIRPKVCSGVSENVSPDRWPHIWLQTEQAVIFKLIFSLPIWDAGNISISFCKEGTVYVDDVPVIVILNTLHLLVAGEFYLICDNATECCGGASETWGLWPVLVDSATKLKLLKYLSLPRQTMSFFATNHMLQLGNND